MQAFERLQIVVKLDPVILLAPNMTSDLYLPVSWIEKVIKK